MTFHEWQHFAGTVYDRADRITVARLNEARRTCQAAGLDPGLLGIHPHNAMVSYEAGKPWPEVNYALCRRTLWLIDRTYEPRRIAERIVGRAWDRIKRGQ